MQTYLKKDTVVEDAIRITTVLTKHLAESDCTHSIQQIMSEVFEQDTFGFEIKGARAQPQAQHHNHQLQDGTTGTSPISEVSQKSIVS